MQALEAGLGLFRKRRLGLGHLAQDSGGHGFLAHRLLSPWEEVPRGEGSSRAQGTERGSFLTRSKGCAGWCFRALS